MATRRVKSADVQGLRGATDWKKVKAMTDAEIKSAARSDPNSPELTPQDLLRFKRKQTAKRS